ncbi:hypothetical protein [Chryseolinea lacunae]|uniref:Lipoprotein n=1 Tax=Chryseolinea lacunae TaxID=2801331 RepID=A0ABS1KLR4_9BACT|nr:hypothetical protein [Chryseolinea lacunae]MBL0740273.1 hypothetical protein [Chryseolinea lacunae]
MAYLCFYKTLNRYSPMHHRFVIALFIVLFAACQPRKEQSSETTATPSQSAVLQSGCYAFHKGGSTIQLDLEVNGERASGQLLYSLEEKDKNTGTIHGTAKGNTLDVYYVFLSEGITSTREVIFQLTDSALVEGIGNHEERNDTSFYADKSKVRFENSQVVLTPCPKP